MLVSTKPKSTYIRIEDIADVISSLRLERYSSFALKEVIEYYRTIAEESKISYDSRILSVSSFISRFDGYEGVLSSKETEIQYIYSWRNPTDEFYRCYNSSNNVLSIPGEYSNFRYISDNRWELLKKLNIPSYKIVMNEIIGGILESSKVPYILYKLFD